MTKDQNLKDAPARLHRVAIDLQNWQRLENWSRAISDHVKGAHPSISEVANFVFESIGNAPTESELRRASQKFFDPIAAARWGLNRLIGAEREGKVDPMAALQELNKLLDLNSKTKPKKAGRIDETPKQI